jgi:AcrR family transcriptional regulator
VRSASAPADTRGRIEAAALKLFASRGVDGTSIRDIAQAVGVTEGALYRHFSSKEAFARALFLDRYGALARGVEAARANHRGFDARLDALVGFFADTFDADPDGFAYVLIAQHEHLRALDQSAEENAVAALVRVFEEAMAEGEIPEGDPALAAAMALGLVVQPAIFHIYGRLDRGPSAYRGEIAGAIRRAVGRG